MANLASQPVRRAGVVPTYAACTAGGDTFTPDANTFLHVKNGSGGALTVTVAAPQAILDLTTTSLAVSVGATSEKMIGPFPAQTFAAPATGLASITYSGVTTLTIAVVQLVQP